MEISLRAATIFIMHRVNRRPLLTALRIITLIVTLLAAGPSEAADPFPRAAAAYLLKRDGTTLWANRPDRRLPPASLTKVMTALLVIERGDLDAVVTVSRSAAAETGTRLGLRPGERVRAGDLLAATLLNSANDACHALADHVAGSERRFVALMNERAVRLGLAGTHFTNACGHHHPHHYSTAADLARLTEAALTHPRFRKLVALPRHRIRSLSRKLTYHLENRNRLLTRYPGAAGVKTGYTPEAGRCLIALAERDGVRVLLVLLRARARWEVADAMLDRAFAECSESPRSDREATPPEAH